jgi:hypothetical protein
MNDNRTLAELAREALTIQNASNLSGLVHGWSRSMTRLRELLPNADTRTINYHPVSKMWASKVHELTCMGFSESVAFSEALAACEELAKG